MTTRDVRETVERAFPAVDAIDDDDLRSGVVDAWATALGDTGHDLETTAWFPPVQSQLDLPDERLVDHVNDVVEGAVGLAETLLSRRDVDLSLDTVIAGALVHDVSKLYEFEPDAEAKFGASPTPVYDLLGHPYYGVYAVARAGLPVELCHVVLSHTSRTSVEPATLEAEIVRRADEVAASAIRMRALDDLRDA